MYQYFLVLCGFLVFTSRAVALSGLILSANYWPAYNDNNSAGGSTYQDQNSEQAALGQTAWQSQAPWYCVPAPSRITCNLTQAYMDQDLQLAQAVGVTNFAFYWTGAQAGGVNFQYYPPDQQAWDTYQASPENTRVKWTLNLRLPFIGANPFSDTTQLHANIDQIVAYMGQSTYQKMGANRPILYIFYVAADLTNWFAGSQVNVKTATDYVRSQAIAAGLGNPYIVFQVVGVGAAAQTNLTAMGGDAASEYIAGVSTGTFRPATVAASNTYATYDAAVQARWVTLAGASTKIVPVVQPGQDYRARNQTPPPWEAGNTFPRMGLSLFYQAGTPAAIAAGQMTALGVWMDANPTLHDGVAWLYSWTEHGEGGTAASQPTLGDPPLTSPPYTGGASSGLTLKLNAIGPVLYGYR